MFHVINSTKISVFVPINIGILLYGELVYKTLSNTNKQAAQGSEQVRHDGKQEVDVTKQQPITAAAD